MPHPATGPAAPAPVDPAPADHAAHDAVLVAAYAAGDAEGPGLEAATALVAGCADCAALHRDLRAIAAALPELPAPARTRDFRLTPGQAASLRPSGWRRLLAPFAGPRFAFAAPLGSGLAALGIVGILARRHGPAAGWSDGGRGCPRRPSGPRPAALRWRPCPRPRRHRPATWSWPRASPRRPAPPTQALTRSSRPARPTSRHRAQVRPRGTRLGRRRRRLDDPGRHSWSPFLGAGGRPGAGPAAVRRPVRNAGTLTSEPAGQSRRLGRDMPHPATGPAAPAPVDPAPADHAAHDAVLVAAYAAGDAEGPGLEAATALVAGCADCAALHHDLRAIAAALPELPAPARTRDFRLTPGQAASLRPSGWRRLLAPFAGPRFAFAAPLGSGLAALGIVGILARRHGPAAGWRDRGRGVRGAAPSSVRRPPRIDGSANAAAASAVPSAEAQAPRLGAPGRSQVWRLRPAGEAAAGTDKNARARDGRLDGTRCRCGRGQFARRSARDLG